MDIREIKSIIEGLLFIWGDPLTAEDISTILEMDKEEVTSLLEEMMDDFDYNRRGVRIVKANDTYQLSTRPEHYQWIKKLNHTKPNRSLSNAAMETLAIIAYRQPIIKSEIDNIRGVKSDRSLETLMEKKLVQELGRLDKIGRPIVYGTTDEFLRLFSLESLDDLPDFQEMVVRIDEEFNEYEE
ncbi:MAG: SMC-Scp complex subunit ScpB [Tissierellaceae bacterium]|jgi:segregation and condensation protein B|nr:SMC-Scp complex subunit ScpB [Tissierellia bacterium]